MERGIAGELGSTMKRIVILTGSELRHTFFRKYIASDERIEVLGTYCEGMEKSLPTLVSQQSDNELRTRHLQNREQSERDFYQLFVDSIPDRSKPVSIARGELNTPQVQQAIAELKPDLLVAYGCSLVREPLLSMFAGKFLNVHLGLSPYYRGSGTNFWPLVNGEPEYVGATFMHIDAGVDTGEIIHQIRARVVWGDTPSSIGNRLIQDMARVYRELVIQFDLLQKMPQLGEPSNVRIYKKAAFSEDSVTDLYSSFAQGLVERYLSDREQRCQAVPIVENPLLTGLVS